MFMGGTGLTQHVKYVSNGGYGGASLGLSLDIVGQGREQGRGQSHPDPQGGGRQVQRHRRDRPGTGKVGKIY